jgi:DNA-binding PadR family transcriptional regulator
MGLLDGQEMHGYKLKRAFESHLGPVWTVNFGQIYQVLKDLKRRGLVEARFDPGGSHMGRWMYTLTSKGRRALDTWLRRTPQPPAPVRGELFIRLLAAAPGASSARLDQIAREEVVCRAQLEELLAQRTAFDQIADESTLLRSAAIEAAVVHTRAHLEWLTYCAHVFAAEHEPHSRRGPTRSLVGTEAQQHRAV